MCLRTFVLRVDELLTNIEVFLHGALCRLGKGNHALATAFTGNHQELHVFANCGHRQANQFRNAQACGIQHFEQADEIFSSGNYSKVMPIYRIDDRQIQPGPMFRKARELYMDFAHSK